MNNWICDLSYYPVRAEPDHSSQMVSMLLFGETFQVTDSYKNWYYTKNDFDAYKGWIYLKETNIIELAKDQEFTYTTLPWTIVHYNTLKYYLGIGCRLPLNDNIFSIGNKNFNIDKDHAIQTKVKTVSDIIELASKFLGIPYLWGGKTTHGFDCSGFIQTLFRVAGLELPRDTSLQLMSGRETTDPLDGDLAFFATDGKIDHIGMLYDNDKIIHASCHVRTDRLDEKGIYNENLKEYTHFLHSIRRV